MFNLLKIMALEAWASYCSRKAEGANLKDKSAWANKAVQAKRKVATARQAAAMARARNARR